MAYESGQTVDFESWRFEVHEGTFAQDFITNHAKAVRDLAVAAFTHALTPNIQPPHQVATAVHDILHDDEPLDEFAELLATPEYAVRRGYLNPALFANQRLVVAYNGDADMVGLSLSMNTTTGHLAQKKMNIDPRERVPLVGGKRYAWHRLEVLREDERGRGGAEAMGDIGLAGYFNEQPTTAFTYARLLPKVAGKLVANGFEAGMPVVKRLGTIQAGLVRYQGNVGVVRGRMRQNLPGLDTALARAASRTQYYYKTN